MQNRSAIFVSGRDFNLYRSRMPVMAELLRRGWEVHGLASGTETFRPLLEEAGVQFHHIPFYRHGFSLRTDLCSRARIKEHFRRINPALVHCFNPKPLLLTAGAFPILPKTAHNFCTVTGTGFAQSTSLRARVLSRVYSHILSRFDSIMFENESDAEAFREFPRVARCQYTVQISSGVNMELYDDRTEAPTERIRFLFASRLLWSKGLRELLEASAELSKLRPGKFEMIVAGEPEYDHEEGVPQDVLHEAARNGHITFLGHIALHEMPSVIGTVHVIVLPSYREGFSKVLMEGAAAGKPLIASDIPGCREAVDDHVNGLLIRPRSAGDLMQALLTIVDAPYLVVSMGVASRKKAKEEFDQARLVEKTLAFYAATGVAL